MILNRQPWRLLPRLLFGFACVGAGVGLGLLVRNVLADPHAEVRAELSRLPSTTRRELLRNYGRFLSLSPAEQQQLRVLHHEFETDADVNKHFAVMENYVEWLKDLSPTQRSELTSLIDNDQERLARIDEYQREQLRKAPLTAEDIQQVVAWLDGLVQNNLDIDGRNLLNRSEDDGERKRRLLWFASQRLQERGGSGRALVLSDADIQQLSAKLSPQARQRLSDAKTLPDKRREIVGWVNLAMRRLHGGFRSWQTDEVSEQELVQFFESKLDDPKREELLGLPPAERIERLRMFYFRDKYPDRPFGPPSFGRPPGMHSNGPRFEGDRPPYPPNSDPRDNRRNGEGTRGEGMRSRGQDSP